MESPFAGDIDRNIKYAKLAIQDCLNRGEAPIASHLLFTQEGILNDDDLTERALGICAGLSWVRRADAMVVYEDHGRSRGMQEAITYAIRHSIPVEYRFIY